MLQNLTVGDVIRVYTHKKFAIEHKKIFDGQISPPLIFKKIFNNRALAGPKNISIKGLAESNLGLVLDEIIKPRLLYNRAAKKTSRFYHKISDGPQNNYKIFLLIKNVSKVFDPNKEPSTLKDKIRNPIRWQSS